MEEQVLENTAIQTEAETQTTETETVEQKTEPRMYSEEEYNKAVQSASGKAKNEILKELGITSVKDFNILKQTYETAIKDAEVLASTNESLSNRLILKDLDIRDDVIDDFISLAKKRVSDNKSFEQAAKEVAEIYPTMVKTFEKQVKVATEKKDGSKKEHTYSEEMLKRYPHLRNHTKI
jgi:hypothetical protein